MDLVERTGSSARRHPWELARAEFFLRLLRRRGALESGRDWLDVGSGDAWFAEQLRRLLPEQASVTCWDINYSAEDLEAEHEGLTLVSGRPSRRFDRMLMLDVVEHVPDDLGFVRGLVDELLEERGLVLFSVPAYQALFSSHDEALRHERRYSPDRGRRLIQASGLEIVADGGLFVSLLPLRLAQVVRERIRAPRSASTGIGEWGHGPALTGLISKALITDGSAALALSERGVALPGLSYWALCRRSDP